jgi:hypothetical protein
MGVVRAIKKSPHIPPKVLTSTRNARFAEPDVAVNGTLAIENVRIGSPPPLRKRITITDKTANVSGIRRSSAYTRAGILAKTKVIAESVKRINRGATGPGETTQINIAPIPRINLR